MILPGNIKAGHLAAVRIALEITFGKGARSRGTGGGGGGGAAAGGALAQNVISVEFYYRITTDSISTDNVQAQPCTT